MPGRYDVLCTRYVSYSYPADIQVSSFFVWIPSGACSASPAPPPVPRQMTTNKPKAFVCLLHRCGFQAAVIKLAQEFWCGQEPSPVLIPNFVVISGHVVECASSKVSSKVRENAIITTIDDKDIVKEDGSTNDTTTVVAIVCDSLKTDREDGAKQPPEEKEEVTHRGCALFRRVQTHEGWLAESKGCDLCLTEYDILLAASRFRLIIMIGRLKYCFRFPIQHQPMIHCTFFQSAIVPTECNRCFRKRSVCKQTVLPYQQPSMTGTGLYGIKKMTYQVRGTKVHSCWPGTKTRSYRRD